MCSGGDSKTGEISLKKDKKGDRKKDKTSTKHKKQKNGKKENKQKTEKREAKGEGVQDQTVQQQIVEDAMEYDETNLKTLLPTEPTLEDAFNDEQNLEWMKEAREKAIEFASWLEDYQWNEFKDKDGVVVYKCPNASSNEIIVKRETTVDATIDACVDVLRDLSLVTKANDRIESVEEVQEVGTGSRIIYQKMKGNMIVTGRDFVTCNTLIKLKNGDSIIVNYGVELDDYPPTSKPIRGETRVLFWLKRISDDQTEIINMLNMDMGGSLPGMAQSKIPEKQWEELKNLKAKMET